MSNRLKAFIPPLLLSEKFKVGIQVSYNVNHTLSHIVSSNPLQSLAFESSVSSAAKAKEVTDAYSMGETSDKGMNVSALRACT